MTAKTAEHDTVMGALRSAQDVIEGILNAAQCSVDVFWRQRTSCHRLSRLHSDSVREAYKHIKDYHKHRSLKNYKSYCQYEKLNGVYYFKTKTFEKWEDIEETVNTLQIIPRDYQKCVDEELIKK